MVIKQIGNYKWIHIQCTYSTISEFRRQLSHLNTPRTHSEADCSHLEINNLKIYNENKLKELASLQKDIQQIKSDSLERENILKQEAVKLKNIIKEAQVKHDLQNKDLQIEIKAKNDAILAFQKNPDRN